MSSRAKVIEYCNDRFKGSLTEDVCNNLEVLIKLDNENGCVADLRHIIYNMSDSDVQEYIYNMSMFNAPMQEFDKPHGTLKDYQTVGVAYLYNAKNCILGDSVGMGKTVEIAGLFNLLKVQYEKQGKKFRYLFLTEDNQEIFNDDITKFEFFIL